jgi:PAS domain-containing protein
VELRLARELELRVALQTHELSQVRAALAREIAERLRTELALRESEASLRSVIDGIPGFVAIMTPAGAVEAVNRQIVEYTGKPLEELKQWGTNGTVHAEDLPTWQRSSPNRLRLACPTKSNSVCGASMADIDGSTTAAFRCATPPGPSSAGTFF